MNACFERELAQLRKHQTIGARWVAHLVETIGRGCRDGLRDIFCARVGDGILLCGHKGSSPCKRAGRLDREGRLVLKREFRGKFTLIFPVLSTTSSVASRLRAANQAILSLSSRLILIFVPISVSRLEPMGVLE
jgi:hypothetical protein